MPGLKDALAQLQDLERRVNERKLSKAKQAEKQARERELVSRVRTRAKNLKPRPYQAECIEFLKNAHREVPTANGRLVGDAPGLGKTFQTAESATLPCIVSCTLALVEQWVEYLQTEYPGDKIAVAAYGNAIKRDEAISSDWDWLIINHDAWRTYLPGKRAKTLIVDEIHHFRNGDAKRSKNLAQYAHAMHKINGMLTFGASATLVFKDIGDLWHLLHIVDPTKHPHRGPWINQFAVTADYGYGTKVVRVKDQKALDRAVAPYILQRSYKDVGIFLPERIDKDIALVMPEVTAKIYRELRDHYRLEMDGMDEPQRFTNAGAVLHALRMFTVTEEKLHAVKDEIESIPGTLPIIVFCWYKETAKKAAEFLDGVCVTGDEQAKNRRSLMVTGGPEGKRVRVCTMSSVAEGIEGLADSKTVFFLEEDYTPGRNYQAMTRVIRFNKNETGEPVKVYYVRYKKTVDEIVHNTAKSRTEGNAFNVVKDALGY